MSKEQAKATTGAPAMTAAEEARLMQEITGQKPAAPKDPSGPGDVTLEAKKVVQAKAETLNVLASDKTADQLAKYLLDSGTPETALARFQAERDAGTIKTAEQLFRAMDSTDRSIVNIGTLKKAGKHLWGPAWEPETAAQLAPAEEVVRIRSELSQVQAQLRAVVGEKRVLTAQLQYEQESKQDLVRQVSMLRAQLQLREAQEPVEA